jgi:hypothetical protein
MARMLHPDVVVRLKPTGGGRSMFSTGYCEAERESGVDREQRWFRQLLVESGLQAFRCQAVVDETRDRRRSGSLRKSRPRVHRGRPPEPTLMKQGPTAGAHVMHGVADERVPHGRPSRACGPPSPNPLTRSVDGAGRLSILEPPARGEHRRRQDTRDGAGDERAPRCTCPIAGRRRHAVLDKRERFGFRNEPARSPLRRFVAHEDIADGV